MILKIVRMIRFLGIEIGRNNMNKIICILAFGMLISGCVDVNLKTKLPVMNYYNLDKLEIKDEYDCGAYNFIAIASIEVPQEYRNNKILYKEGSKITYSTNASFIKNINESFESMMIKNFAQKCIKTIVPPLSGISIENFLRLKLLDFSINKDKKEASVAMYYQIDSKGVLLQSGILTSSIYLDSIDDDTSISALQESSINIIEQLANKIIPK